MRRRSFNESGEGSSAPPLGPDHTRMCRVPGCRNLWAVDVNFGRVCSDHDAAFTHSNAAKTTSTRPAAPASAPLPFRTVVPTHEPSGWWTEPNETGPDA